VAIRLLIVLAFLFASTQAGLLLRESISISGPVGPIRGVYERSDDQSPTFVGLLIGGSGPTDLDGNNRFGVSGNIYRSLAAALVGQGGAIARFDKRGIASSAGALLDPNFVTIQDYAQDVQAWIDLLKAKTRLPCVWLIGHSEGGLIALEAARHNAQVCGLVLIATPGRPLAEVLHDQLARETSDPRVFESLATAVNELQQGKTIDPANLPNLLAILFPKAIQHYMASLFRVDPAAIIREIRVPVLIVQGTNDLQVSLEDATHLKNANASAELAPIPHMNHVFRDIADHDDVRNASSYADASIPIDPALAESITKFVKNHTTPTRRRNR
jgi:pimeloyl-ACP methyl ester carboxylesterase